MGLINQMLTATRSSRINISDEEKTKLVAKTFSKYLKRGDVLLLNGELGVGKTTFIKYLINCLQSKFKQKKTEVPSPTFNIVYEYKVKNLIVQHYDLYRIKDHNELQNIGLYENMKDTLTLIEWPEIIKQKPKNRIELMFNYEHHN
mgnify:CR=1 FL=1